MYTALNSLSSLQDVFDGSIISTGLWPPGSPDLSVCDFFFVGKPKRKRAQEYTSHCQSSPKQNKECGLFDFS